MQQGNRFTLLKLMLIRQWVTDQCDACFQITGPYNWQAKIIVSCLPWRHIITSSIKPSRLTYDDVILKQRCQSVSEKILKSVKISWKLLFAYTVVRTEPSVQNWLKSGNCLNSGISAKVWSNITAQFHYCSTLKCTHLVIIRPIAKQFRTHVIRCTYQRCSHIIASF